MRGPGRNPEVWVGSGRLAALGGPWVPFVSQAQRAFMHENHPAIAARWDKITPKGQALPNHVSGNGTSSEESPAPGIQKLPRVSGPKRDYGPLFPSAKARLKTSSAASEKDSSEEWGTEAHHPDGRKEKMSLPSKHVLDELGNRDVRTAVKGLRRK